MAKLQALSATHHKHVKINGVAAQTPCANQRMMPVVMSEFLRLAVQYPILLTKDSETGQFVCVAMLGFEAGENLFWRDGAWDAVYTPLNVRRQPFFIGANDQKQQETDHDYLICINMENEGVGDQAGEAPFDEAGQPTAYLSALQSVLGALIEGEVQTRAFIDKLLALKLLTPISLDITLASGEKMRAEGMYSIDEEALKNLEADQVVALHQQDYLGPIYTMIASLGQIYALIRQKNARAEAPSKWLQKDNL